MKIKEITVSSGVKLPHPNGVRYAMLDVGSSFSAELDESDDVTECINTLRTNVDNTIKTHIKEVHARCQKQLTTEK